MEEKLFLLYRTDPGNGPFEFRPLDYMTLKELERVVLCGIPVVWQIKGMGTAIVKKEALSRSLAMEEMHLKLPDAKEKFPSIIIHWDDDTDTHVHELIR